ncbi:MAG: oligogalacturonate lyase family protein [Gemmataceae bacterium]|nr:oligogalacturonate lyase family protein [Gemmataceae bacterium]
MTAQRLALLLCCFLTRDAAGQQPPIDWVEPATGHRVIRLTGVGGGSSFYFHQNGYTANGDRLLISTKGGLATINLVGFGRPQWERNADIIVEGRAGSVVVGKKSRQAFYTRGNAIYTTHLDTKATRKIADLPVFLRMGSGLAVNAEETTLAGSAHDPKAKDEVKDRGKVEPKPKAPPAQGKGKKGFVAGGRSMVLFTVDIKSGAFKKFHPATDWLNHVQFSPTDPDLIMFCHEGPWHEVDRIWTIRTDGTGLRKIHTRTMPMEIAGHEFFSSDGKTIWFDLQTPKYKEFWLAGVELESGDKIRYKLAREHWSVHFNQSPDGKLFEGDGGGPKSVAAPGNGQWIYRYTPQKDGTLKVDRLVDLAKHDYTLEPNVTFTPDGAWIVFRSNMHGATHVYAVEVWNREEQNARKGKMD